MPIPTVVAYVPTAPEALPTKENSRFWPPENKSEPRQIDLRGEFKDRMFIRVYDIPDKMHKYVTVKTKVYSKIWWSVHDKWHLHAFKEARRTLDEVRRAITCFTALEVSIGKSGLEIDIKDVKELFNVQLLYNVSRDLGRFLQGSPPLLRLRDLEAYPEDLHAKMTKAELIWSDNLWENRVREAPEEYRDYLNSCREAMPGSDPLILPFMIYRNNLLIVAACAAPKNSKANAWIEGEIESTPAGGAFDVDSSSVKLPAEDST